MNLCVFLCVIILILVIFLIVKYHSCPCLNNLESFQGGISDEIMSVLNQKERDINERIRDHEARISALEKR